MREGMTHRARIAAGIDLVLDRAGDLTPRQARRLAREWRRSLARLERYRLELEMALAEADVDGAWTDHDIDRIDMAFTAVGLVLRPVPLRVADRGPVLHAVAGVVLAALTSSLTPLYVAREVRIELARPWLTAVGPLPADLF